MGALGDVIRDTLSLTKSEVHSAAVRRGGRTLPADAPPPRRPACP